MNKAMLIGNVGREPEVRYYEADQAMAVVTLATTERGYKLANGTQVPDHTDWHTVLLYRGLAKIVERYVHKGDKLYIEGRIRYRSYDDQRGMKRYVTEILAENMELLSPKPAAQRSDTAAPKPEGPSEV
ncbi:MAG: single-stranded DNA-binding protein [Prevotella sp.]|nr:single-stranded DNA-binding protein [Prevotella sp.]